MKEPLLIALLIVLSPMLHLQHAAASAGLTDLSDQMIDEGDYFEVDLDNDVNFLLYTSLNPDEPSEIYANDLNGTYFDGSKCIKILVHGFGSNGYLDWIRNMTDLFITIEDCNVIAVDWEKPAASPLYNVAKANTKPVGFHLGNLLGFLEESSGVQLTKVHCLGHSLGAHVCGFGGKFLNGRVGRITGLDPALPLFSYENVTERLASTDAIFVDVIHTCGGLLGFDLPIGHVDFYPNGGVHKQPGCGFDPTASCSHERCWVFFIESIESSEFRAVQCTSWEDFQIGACGGNTEVPMGYPTPEDTRGFFFLQTSDVPPYALG
ncbi:lipase member H-A-like isoform X2 [Cloeon dipterum]|uniref:lipase member H-A-like isoform X2 n=1 Tax=Cloeon dipterum TaxID=197152 RepID=UPI00321FDFDF